MNCENCHGCKFLDETKKASGYCCHVVLSKDYKGKESEDRVRRPWKPRCELYEPGDFKTRYQTRGGRRE